MRDIKSFWNERASLGPLAGTRDVIAKQLEMDAIAEYVRDGMRVLDVGCSNGLTAIHIAERCDVQIVGIDFADELVQSAVQLAQSKSLKGQVTFLVGNVTAGLSKHGTFDLAYTERTLINLPDWNTQALAIRNICDVLASGGLYVMCENSQDGLDELNELRSRIQLPAITPPWHNRYFRDTELSALSMPNATCEGIVHYSSTYYFLSRIVNAYLARCEGHEPDYESPVNQLALRLPAIGQLGQGRIWLWRKA